MDPLSPAQTERLALLMEECAEVIQMAGKSLRHGFESTHKDYGYRLNEELLAVELGHVLAAVDLLVERGDLSRGDINTARDAKAAKIRRGTHFHYQAAPSAPGDGQG